MKLELPQFSSANLKEGQADAIILIAVGVIVIGYLVKKVL